MTTKTSSLKRESKTVNQAPNITQSNPLTPERTEELKKRVEQLPGPSNEDNLLAFLLRKMESLDEWLGGPPRTQQDRAKRDVSEQEALNRVRLRML